jgi:hypothetical protein
MSSTLLCTVLAPINFSFFSLIFSFQVMKTTAFIFAAALLFSSLGASAQDLALAPAAQELAGTTAPSPAGTSRSITYFGVVNSPDAKHAQYAQLRQVFAATRPTLVVVEKPDLGTAATEAATIETKGPAGYARLLAQQYQVPIERLDDPDAEYAYLRTKVDAEQLKLYYLLRAAHNFRKHTGASPALMAKAMQQLIDQSTYFIPGTEHVIQNMAELTTAYKKYCPTGGQWWDAPAAYFCPQAAVALYPSGSFCNTLGSAINEYREQNVYSKLAARAEAGERILVVTSCDQLPSTLAAGALAAK